MNEEDKLVQKEYPSYKILNFLIIYMMPLTFIFILLVFQFINEASPYNPEYYFYLFTTNLSFLIITFAILSLLAILLTYKLLIPYIQSCSDKTRIPTLKTFLITYGSTTISIFGLIIGLLGYFNYNLIDWFIVISFILVGTIYGVYLLRKYSS
jgi:hypothetical protein